jgi:hypothetical protein
VPVLRQGDIAGRANPSGQGASNQQGVTPMNFHQRLNEIENNIDGEFPTFAVCCRHRWPLHVWFHRLAEQRDIGRVRSSIAEVFQMDGYDDDELRERLKNAKQGDAIALPVGAIPPPTSDPLLQNVLENRAALRNSTIIEPPDDPAEM